MRRQRGQALVFVTISLAAMFAMMGLAVDIGWMFYVKRTAQAAADAAALAAARRALLTVGQIAAFSCGENVECTPDPVACTTPVPFSMNLESACSYAELNKFTHAGRQSVTVAANTVPNSGACSPNCIPTAPGVIPIYWVTVRVGEDVPQLFSAVLGRSSGRSAARATAAIINVNVAASLILLNRENDVSALGTGRNLAVIGNASVDVPGGMRLASASSSGNNANGWAGYTQGAGLKVTGAYTHIRDGGAVNAPEQWDPQPVNRPDGTRFRDPYERRGQPPITKSILPNCPVAAGTVLQGVLGPGNYYYVQQNGTVYQATGQPLRFGSGVRFTARSSTSPVDLTGGMFVPNSCKSGDPTNGEVLGDYVFYGGLENTNGTTPAIIEPGRYVIAGTAASNNNARLLNLTNGVPLNDLTIGGGPNSDAGVLFILTNGQYRALDGSSLDTQFSSISLLNQIRGNLRYAPSHIQGGNQSQSVNLHGLNPRHPAVTAASTLSEFGPLVIWQDRNNSRIRHLDDGRVDTSCGGLSAPCPNTLSNSNCPEFYYQGSPSSVLYGAIAQPRGAWSILVGGGASDGDNHTQIISGAIEIRGNSQVRLGTILDPITVRRAVLVE